MENQENENQARAYPARSQRQWEIAWVPPGKTVWIAGRILEAGADKIRISDFSGSLELHFPDTEFSDQPGHIAEPSIQPGRIPEPSIPPGHIAEVEGRLESNGRFTVCRVNRLAPGCAHPPSGSANEGLWRMSPQLFERRRRIKDALRSFFLDLGFLEVETPILVKAPGQEPHLDPFRTRLDDGKEGGDRFLITSPEYYHKRLLAAGYEKIFEVARVFRNGPSELHGLHAPEFNMVEWYRAYASYLEIMVDMENLIPCLAQAAGYGDKDLLAPPYERLSMEEAFQRHAGVPLAPFLDNDSSFAREAAEHRQYGLSPEDSLKTRFYKIWVSAVEPRLGFPGPVFLLDFPASEASLSKLREDRPQVCERFELYINGMELANGFTELNDPEEQERRFDLESREREGASVPRDHTFLEALALGMPPAGGVALGFDRLVMLLLGEKELDRVVPFSHT